eukprot:scaffold172474_cov31-Tisochrysis_lutea.AAC.2
MQMRSTSLEVGPLYPTRHGGATSARLESTVVDDFQETPSTKMCTHRRWCRGVEGPAKLARLFHAMGGSVQDDMHWMWNFARPR